MAKLEKEVKILAINIEETQNKLDTFGAIFKGKKEQKIYTYDVLSIKYRIYEAIELLKSENELLITTSLRKLSVAFDELYDLVDDKKLDKIFKELKVDSFDELLKLDVDDILSKIENSSELNDIISSFSINPNKWIRLRKSNDKVELTVKHVYDKDDNKIQKVKEFEIEVSDLNETNKLLEELGVVRRNYQEKIRYSYKYKDAEIELDIWPKLEPYMEIECDDENVINEIINKLNFEKKKIVSVNTEQLYKEKGLDILKISDLKF